MQPSDRSSTACDTTVRVGVKHAMLPSLDASKQSGEAIQSMRTEYLDTDSKDAIISTVN